MSANPPHSFGYASGLLPCSDEKIYANLTDFILSAIPLLPVLLCLLLREPLREIVQIRGKTVAAALMRELRDHRHVVPEIVAHTA